MLTTREHTEIVFETNDSLAARHLKNSIDRPKAHKNSLTTKEFTSENRTISKTRAREDIGPVAE